MGSPDEETRPRRKRPPARLSEASLEKKAAHWIKRFWGPSAGLRRVLRRHADASMRTWGGDKDEAYAMIEALIDRLLSAGILNDREVASQRARSMHERGASLLKIRSRLYAVGLSAADIDAGIEALDEGEGKDALQWRAAVIYARRRRLGVFRLEDRQERRQRDLAAMARAGFSYDLARRIVDATETDELQG